MAIHCGHCTMYHSTIADVRACSRGEAAPAFIDRKSAEPAARTVDVESITEGMWVHGVTVYKVVKAHYGSGNLYAKRLEPELQYVDGDGPHYKARWTAPAGLRRWLAENGAKKMSLEDATKFGSLYGFCCNCGKILTREESIEAGIGPVCAQKFAA